MNWIIWVPVGIVVLLLIIFFGIGFLVWKALVPTPDPSTYDNKPTRDQTENDLRTFKSRVTTTLERMDLEEMEIRAFDGTRLHGYYKEAGQKTTKTIICVHGWHGSALKDAPLYSHWLVDYNMNILYIDLRSYGKSEGRYTTYGVLDSKDVLSWVNHIIGIVGEDAQIALFGISIGGNTVCSIADKVPKQVKCIIDDCGYTSCWDQMVHMVKNVLHMPVIFLYSAEFFNRIIAHFSLKGSNAKKSLRNSNVPVLFIHGVKDKSVPASMGLELHEACRNSKEIHLFEGVPHCRSYFENKEAYTRIVLTFLAKHL